MNTKSFAVDSRSRLRSTDRRIIMVNRIVGINYVFIEVEADSTSFLRKRDTSICAN